MKQFLEFFIPENSKSKSYTWKFAPAFFSLWSFLFHMLDHQNSLYTTKEYAQFRCLLFVCLYGWDHAVRTASIPLFFLLSSRLITTSLLCKPTTPDTVGISPPTQHWTPSFQINRQSVKRKKNFKLYVSKVSKVTNRMRKLKTRSEMNRPCYYQPNMLRFVAKSPKHVNTDTRWREVV